MYFTDEIIIAELRARRDAGTKSAIAKWQRSELKRLSDNVRVAEHAVNPVMLRGMDAGQIARREAKLSDVRRWMRLAEGEFNANS